MQRFKNASGVAADGLRPFHDASYASRKSSITSAVSRDGEFSLRAIREMFENGRPVARPTFEYKPRNSVLNRREIMSERDSFEFMPHSKLIWFVEAN